MKRLLYWYELLELDDLEGYWNLFTEKWVEVESLVLWESRQIVIPLTIALQGLETALLTEGEIVIGDVQDNWRISFTIGWATETALIADVLNCTQLVTS